MYAIRSYYVPVQIIYDEIVGHMRERIVFPEPGELEVIDRQAQRVLGVEREDLLVDADGRVRAAVLLVLVGHRGRHVGPDRNNFV